MNFNKSIIRFLSLELNNMKNVENGTIFVNGYTKKDAWTKYNLDSSDVIGIYGQNGSGKTSIIQSLIFVRKAILGDKFLLTTKDFQKYVLEDFITKGKEKLSLTARFLITDRNESKIIEYTLSFAHQKELIFLESESFKLLNTDLSSTDIFLSYSHDSKQILEPAATYNQIIATDSELAVTFQLCKVLSEKECSTYLFNSELQKIYQTQTLNEIYSYML